MNKYQEALDSLKCRVTTNSIICEMNQHRKDEICLACNEIKAIETLDELVERATPKKPKGYKPLGTATYYKCPICNSKIGTASDYCRRCGQRILWGEE